MNTTTSTPTQRQQTGRRPGADADTVHLHRSDAIAPPGEPSVPPRPRVDAAKLWTAGLATAVVAALIGVVGSLVVEVIGRAAPHGLDRVDTPALCVAAAVAALAATGLAHLLLVSTPRPLAYLGWIIGLATTATAVLPLTSGVPLPTALAQGVLHLVIGLAVGSLVTGAGAASSRRTTTCR